MQGLETRLERVPEPQEVGLRDQFEAEGRAVAELTQLLALSTVCQRGQPLDRDQLPWMQAFRGPLEPRRRQEGPASPSQSSPTSDQYREQARERWEAPASVEVRQQLNEQLQKEARQDEGLQNPREQPLGEGGESVSQSSG